MEDAVRGAFAKTGDTPFELAALALENPDGLFVPVSLLNALRRDLYAEIKTEEKTTVLPPTGRSFAAEKSGWIIRTDDLDTLAAIDLNEVDEVTVLLSPEFDAERLKTLPKNKLRLALPALERAPAKYAEPVRRLLEGGFRKWEIGNWWGLEMLPANGIDLSFDGSLYMLNTQAVQAAKEAGAGRITLSVEDCLNNMRALAENAPLPVVMPVYQDAPLFTSAVCIRANPCKSCPRGEKWLKLRHEGREYLALSKNCQTMLFAGRPLCFAAEAEKVPAAFYRVDFVYRRYSPEAAASVWKKCARLRTCPDVPKAIWYPAETSDERIEAPHSDEKNETIENAKRNLPAAETKKLSEKNGTGLKAVLPAGCVVWGKVRVCPAPNAGLPGNAASCL